VCLNNQYSDFCNVFSGIAQGSVIGPLLFILYVNDLAEIFGSDIHCKLFADDVKLYSTVDLVSTGINPLSLALDNLVTWSNEWQLSINISKTNVLHMGKNNPSVTYRINNVIISPAKHMRDLGVEIDSNLDFTLHIDRVIKSAYQKIAVLFKGFISRDPGILTSAYKVYVRPTLEYCSEVWSPYLLKHIEALENVQRYFTRRINNLNLYEYVDRLTILNLESLEIRRLKKDLKMYHKIVHGSIDLNCNDFFNIKSNMYHTRGHNLKIIKPFCNSDMFLNTFANRVVDCWNWLPTDIVNLKNIKGFSSKLNIIDLNKFVKGGALK